MKLEQLHKSQYDHDSLGEETFYIQFRKQINNDIFDSHYRRAVSDIHAEMRIINIRAPILEYLNYLRN
jgi:hypothetical protein